MVAFFRQFLVVLLVLLQNAAPLVHAHTGGVDVSQTGLHLYEFETLRLAADHLSMAATNHAINTESCVVNVGSAIKQSQPAAISATPVFLLPANGPVLATARDALIISFAPHTTDFDPQPILSHNSSRAPPR